MEKRNSGGQIGTRFGQGNHYKFHNYGKNFKGDIML